MVIKDNKLTVMMKGLSKEQKENLRCIRNVMTTFWANNSILSDFTDHGIDHSYRVVDYAHDIVKSTKKELTKEDRYLLLASIYLHDIGNQCYPDRPLLEKIADIAKEIATDKRLKFNKPEFTSNSAMDLSPEEQSFIRENHSLLTAAMIKFYSDSKEYLDLHNALIPFKRSIDDLADICLYHSKHDIMRCDTKLSFGNGNKKLIAVILRLADELDISYKRLKKENFNFLCRDPEKLIYWYMHKYTVITIINNTIFFEVTLPEKYIVKYGHIFLASVIKKFHDKNKSLLQYLNENGYAIKMAHINERKKILKNDICRISKNSPDEIPENVLNEFMKLEHKESDKFKHKISPITRCRYIRDLDNLSQKIEVDILKNKKDYNILVLGDIMLDRTMHVISPNYDQVQIHDQLNVSILVSKDDKLYDTLRVLSPDRSSLGGAAGTVTALLEIPNVKIDVIGIIGNDMEGSEVSKLFNNLKRSNDLRNSKLKFIPIIIEDYPTVTKNYYHCHSKTHQNPKVDTYRFDREDNKLIYKNLNKYKNYFEIALEKTETHYDCIIINDYEKGMINDYVIEYIKNKFKDKKTHIYVDPKYNFRRYEELNIKAILPNIKEAYMGPLGSGNANEEEAKIRVNLSDLYDEDYEPLGECLPRCDSVVIKADSNGAILYRKNDNKSFTMEYIHSYPIDESNLKDNIGCGDTFDAYFIIGRLKGYSFQTSINLANVAAGVKRKNELGEVVSPEDVHSEFISFKNRGTSFVFS